MRVLVALLRPDHWFKNVFALPGIVAALAFFPDVTWDARLVGRGVVGLVALCLTASANYVLNAIFDAESDAHHPVKRSRPLPSGVVGPALAWALYAVTTVAGLGISLALGWRFAATIVLLWVMGLAYNIPPVRTKDVAYLDVLSESANNPIRLLAGWWIVAATLPMPPGSLVLSYWMGGGFLMALKRFGELRFLGSGDETAAYRRSLARYDEDRLLAHVLFYACTATAFLGAFAMRYRLELLLSLPVGVGTMAAWFKTAFRDDSPVQRPEHLWKELGVLLAAAVFVVTTTALLFIDLGFLVDLFSTDVPTQAG